MVSLENKIKLFLIDRGMSEQDAEVVLENMKNAPENASIKGRWSEPVATTRLASAWFHAMFNDWFMEEIEARQKQNQ